MNMRVGDRFKAQRVNIAGPYAYVYRALGQPGFVQAVTDGHFTDPRTFRPDRGMVRVLEWNGRAFEEVK